MNEKLINSKIIKFSTVCLGNLINTFCTDEEVELDKDSYISVNGYSTSLKNFKLKKNTKNIVTRKDLLRYFLDQFSDLKFQNIDNDEDEDNGKNLKELFNLEENFKNGKLFITYINDMFNESFNNNENDKKKILENVFNNRTLKLNLKTDTYINIDYNNWCYKLNKEFQDKLDNVNNEIKVYFNVKQIKELMKDKGFDESKISIKDDKGSESEDNSIPDCNEIYVDYKDINNYLEPATAEIEFVAGEGFELEDSFIKNYNIDFVKENILNKTLINKYIYDKYHLNDENCTIEYKDNNDNKEYSICPEYYKLIDGAKLKITINAKIHGFTKEKNPQKQQDQKSKEQKKNSNDSTNQEEPKKGGYCNNCNNCNK